MSGSIFSSASIADILTTLKNGVVAMNTLTSVLSSRISMGRGAMDTSWATLYTVAAGNPVVITNIDICNTAGAPAQIYVALVPSGQTAGTGNALFYGASIPANSSMQWYGAQALAAGDTVQCYASATTCTIMATGAGG